MSTESQIATKIAEYGVIAVSSIGLAFMVLPGAWAQRSKALMPASAVLIYIAGDNMADTFYFFWWATSNYLGQPPWMVAHPSLLAVLFTKIGLNFMLAWALFKTRWPS